MGSVGVGWWLTVKRAPVASRRTGVAARGTGKVTNIYGSAKPRAINAGRTRRPPVQVSRYIGITWYHPIYRPFVALRRRSTGLRPRRDYLAPMIEQRVFVSRLGASWTTAVCLVA